MTSAIFISVILFIGIHFEVIFLKILVIFVTVQQSVPKSMFNIIYLVKLQSAFTEVGPVTFRCKECGNFVEFPLIFGQYGS